jgi:hypothetical protein
MAAMLYMLPKGTCLCSEMWSLLLQACNLLAIVLLPCQKEIFYDRKGRVDCSKKAFGQHYKKHYFLLVEGAQGTQNVVQLSCCHVIADAGKIQTTCMMSS